MILVFRFTLTRMIFKDGLPNYGFGRAFEKDIKGRWEEWGRGYGKGNMWMRSVGVKKGLHPPSWGPSKGGEGRGSRWMLRVGVEKCNMRVRDSFIYLHGILQDEVFALLQLEALIDDAAQDTPGIVHVQVDLGGKLHWLELLWAEDHVLGGVAWIQTGNVTVHLYQKRESIRT